MMQQVITLETTRKSLRAEVTGWSTEDPSNYNRDVPIGLTPEANIPHYKTILEAMADNFRLLCPPIKVSNTFIFEWWLVRDITWR